MPVKIWVDPDDVARHLETNEDKREQICSDIDANGFDWQIWAVAGSGFFTDSYNLFSTNVILPSLAFVYWNTEEFPNHETAINAITLAGSLVGQLVFGYLMDRLGRKRLYGVELLVVIFGIIGFVQCSAGYNNESMSIVSWILFWRFFVGLGIGAEYPLSAVITAEFAPRQSRARMMAAVFLMQPLGQLLASVVGLTVLLTVGRSRGLDKQVDNVAAAATVDIIWRYIIGVGTIPALVAILFRLTIPESPRYTLDVDHDGARALKDTEKYLRIRRASMARGGSQMLETGIYTDVERDADDGRGDGLPMRPLPMTVATSENSPRGFDRSEVGAVDEREEDGFEDIDEEDDGEKTEMPDPFSRSELKDFFITQGNIKYLMGTSLCWFFLDFAFFGLGINNPRVIAQIWSSHQVSNATLLSTAPVWQNPTDDITTIYETLRQDGIRSIITISVGSLLGSLLIIKVINYVPRKAWLVWSFIGMTVLLAVAGGSYLVAANSDLHALTIVFYALCQLLFNLGPNTLTFIIPAEIFPTRYRGTCHGISAAFGKLGSVIAQAFLPSIQITSQNPVYLSWVLIGFSFAMALGAVFAWAWIPEVQNPRGSDGDSSHAVGGTGDINRRTNRTRQGRGSSSKRKQTSKRYEVPNKSLEELARGNAAVVDESLKTGFRHNGSQTIARMGRAVRRRRERRG